MFALVDMNSFYASCETAFRPDLAGQPIVVLSNNDGCVIARSAEAKKLGIKMGTPWFQLRETPFPQPLLAFSSNYELYGDMSQRVMTTLEEICPRVEVYSIDEAFCDLTGVRNCRDLGDFGREIRDTDCHNTRLRCGVGIAHTKALGGLAVKDQDEGEVDLSNIERHLRLMALMPVEEVWEVGRWITKKLEARGISKALQLADTSSPMGRFIFHIMSALAEMERELIVERTRAGLAVARAKGRIGGSRPKVSAEQWVQAGRLIENGMDRKQVAIIYDVAVCTLYKKFPASKQTQSRF
jgi:DNA polymerase V